MDNEAWILIKVQYVIQYESKKADTKMSLYMHLITEPLESMMPILAVKSEIKYQYYTF